MTSSLRLLRALVLLLSFAPPAFAAESLDQTIDYLINHVGKSNATFIRNGVSHTPAEAVAHIKAKYEHFKSEIKTPEDFIRLAASKSLLTGKPYLVRTPNGKEMRLDVWLTEALKQYRAENHQWPAAHEHVNLKDSEGFFLLSARPRVCTGLRDQRLRTQDR